MGWHATPFEGVIVGGGFVAVVNLLLERMRARREVSARFLTERREAYAALLGAADAVLTVHTNLLNVDMSRRQLEARNGELLGELLAFADDPKLVEALKEWQVDPAASKTGEMFRDAFAAVQPRLSDARNDEIRVKLDEALRLPAELDALFAKNDEDIAALEVASAAMKQAYTQVELCAGSKIRHAASRLIGAMSETTADRPATVRAIAEGREAFATAARLELGAPR